MINYIKNKDEFYTIPCNFYFFTVDTQGKFISTIGKECLNYFDFLKEDLNKVKKVGFRHTHIINKNLIGETPSLTDEVCYNIKKYILYCTQSPIKDKYEDIKKEECYESIVDLLFDWTDKYPEKNRIVNIECIEDFKNKSLSKEDNLSSIFESVSSNWTINLFNHKVRRMPRKKAVPEEISTETEIKEMPKTQVFLSSLESSIFLKLNIELFDKLFEYLLSIGVQKNKYSINEILLHKSAVDSRKQTLVLDYYNKDKSVNLWVTYTLDKYGFLIEEIPNVVLQN